MAKFFDEIKTNFENSMRGLTLSNGRLVKAFPHTAGSVFISKIVSLLGTIINDKSVLANLDYRTVKQRIYSNGRSLVAMMVLDETVELENMLFIFESFQNISIDTYLGMKQEGKLGQLQKEIKEFGEDLPELKELKI